MIFVPVVSPGRFEKTKKEGRTMPRALSLLALVLGWLIIFKYRYRIINLLFANRLIRRTVISLLMSIPSVRSRLMQTVFPPAV